MIWLMSMLKNKTVFSLCVLMQLAAVPVAMAALAPTAMSHQMKAPLSFQTLQPTRIATMKR